MFSELMKMSWEKEEPLFVPSVGEKLHDMFKPFLAPEGPYRSHVNSEH